jgi:hypothetical protein
MNSKIQKNYDKKNQEPNNWIVAHNIQKKESSYKKSNDLCDNSYEELFNKLRGIKNTSEITYAN